MRLVKGAVLALLETSAERQDEVAVIAFRATTASIVVEPTRNRDDARRALEHLPTGGRTPLAHALELAARLATPETTLVLVTDGKANVPSRTEDAWTDALAAAAAIDCPVLVVDSELDAQGTGRGKALATALHATHVMLDGLEGEQLLRLADACAETRRDRMA
jgi:magnesium chelatase subunit D